MTTQPMQPGDVCVSYNTLDQANWLFWFARNSKNADTLTLQRAPYEVALGFMALASLLEAIVCHHRVRFNHDFLRKAGDEGLLEIGDWLLSTGAAPFISDDPEGCRAIVKTLLRKVRWPYFVGDYVGTLLLADIVAPARTVSGLAPVHGAPGDLDQFYARTYWDYATSLLSGIHFVSNDFETPILRQVDPVPEALSADASELALRKAEEVRDYLAEVENQRRGFAKWQFRLPLILGYLLKDSRTLTEVVQRANELSRRKPVRRFRSWTAQIDTQDDLAGFATFLKDLDRITSDIATMLDEPKDSKHSLTLGISPSLTVSLDAFLRRDTWRSRRPGRFVRELLLFGMKKRGLGEDLRRVLTNEGIVQAIGEDGFQKVVELLEQRPRATAGRLVNPGTKQKPTGQ